jgi:dihydroxyacid dehydratase/phosphogluconate dehydratase
VLREASGEPAGQGVSPPCFRPAQVPGCDKNMPGCLMAMARVNRPSVMVYGGTIRAGCRPDRTDDKLDIISAFEAYGKFTAGGSGTLESAALVAPLLARAPASPI